MADVTLQRTGEFLRVVFELLWYQPEGLPFRDILARIPESMQLTEYESSYYPSTNVPRYEKIIRYATIPLVKAGWLVKDNKGRWYITDEGQEACRKFGDAQKFYEEALRIYNEWRQSHPAIFIPVEDVEERAWEQIQKYLQGMRPFEFQTLVIDLLQAMDYHVTWTSPPGKERGQIDIIAYTDPLGASVPRIVVQVKHKGQTATVEGVKAFMSVLGLDDYGLFFSSGGFTGDAEEEAQERHKFTLIDLESFYDLWVEYYEKLTIEARQRFPLTPISFLSSMEE